MKKNKTEIYMPVNKKKDARGPYYQWGNHGTKYYYIPHNIVSRKAAYDKASKQGFAIKISEKKI